MAQTFEEYFGESDPKLLAKLIAEFIFNLRKKLKLSATQFQERLKVMSGGSLSIDGAKQSRWENGKSVPAVEVQRLILRMHRELSFGAIHRVEFEFELPLFIKMIRDLIFDGEYEIAAEWANRESENGVRIKQDIDSDVWPLLSMYRALLAHLQKDYILAADLAFESRDMHINNKALQEIIEQNAIGLEFDAVKHRDVSDDDRNSILEDLAVRLDHLIRTNRKRYSWARNLLRIYSCLNDEERFTDTFEKLLIKTGDKEMYSLFRNDSDNDLENARTYPVVRAFLTRYKRFSYKGFSTVELLLPTFLLLTGILFGGVYLNKAHANELNFQQDDLRFNQLPDLPESFHDSREFQQGWEFDAKENIPQFEEKFVQQLK